jgi:hypothetical protein
MQHLLVTLTDSANINSLKSSLLKIEGIKRVDALGKEYDDWKNRLHLPGPPLSENQLEELADDMEHETTFFTIEEAKEKGLQMIEEWQKQKGRCSRSGPFKIWPRLPILFLSKATPRLLLSITSEC